MTSPAEQDSEWMAEATLVLVDGGDRQLDSAPSEVGVGALRLSRWQVHPIVPMPAAFGDKDGYLMKLNYDLALEPGAPAPHWFEVGFVLSDGSDADEVAVLDALPHTVFEPSSPQSYALSDLLSFTTGPRSEPANMALPALRPFIDVFGLGSSEVRWRYMGAGKGEDGVRPGS